MEKYFSSANTYKQTKIEAYAERGIITISGNLLNTTNALGPLSNLYQEFLSWLQEYAENPAPRTSVEFSIFYADTPSSFFLAKVCEQLAVIALKAKVHVSWIYHPEDETILDLGLDLKESSSLEMEMVKAV